MPPPYPVVVRDRDWRVADIDWVVLWPRPNIGVIRVRAHLQELTVVMRARILAGVGPTALLETNDPHPRLSEAPGNSRPGGSGAYDENIDRIFALHLVFSPIQPEEARGYAIVR